MAASGQDKNGAVDSRSESAPAGPSVLLLVGFGARREQLLELIRRLAPTSQIESVDGALDAMRHLAHARADLLVLDCAMDGVAGLSLIRHLARAAPSLTVLAFDDMARALPDPACDLWAWDDAAIALQHWLDRRLAHGAQRP